MSGSAKLDHGAGRNAPNDVREFADKLDAASELPGLGSFRPTLKEVAVSLRISPGEPPNAHAFGASSLEAQQLAAVQDVQRPTNARAAAQWRAGTATPNVNGDTCETPLGASSCERAFSLRRVA